VVPWVWINHSEAKSIERFATLPLRGGRTETALGNHYFRKSDYASAEVWFQRALAVDNTNPNANSLLGRLYGLQGNYESSAEYLRRAVAVRPDKASLRRDYVVVLLQIKRCREALPHLLWLVQREPDDVNYWQRLGETMVQAECTDELVAVYEPLLDWLGRYAEAYPADATADVHAGMMLERIGRREAAVERFRRALSVDSTSAMALYGLGTALYSMGESEDARRELEKFLELYPDHPQSDAARAALAP
jgi:tetratricopeptide (TPR) repeat protein